MNREQAILDDESLSYGVEILTESFERSLRKRIGELKQYPDPELMAWKNALNSVAAEIQQILSTEY
ncbi:MAG: hypothetical protein V7K47_13540 [Nostoc sp.]